MTFNYSNTKFLASLAKIDEIRLKIEKMCTINQIKSNRILLKNPPLQYKISLECKKTRENFPSF